MFLSFLQSFFIDSLSKHFNFIDLSFLLSFTGLTHLEIILDFHEFVFAGVEIELPHDVDLLEYIDATAGEIDTSIHPQLGGLLESRHVRVHTVRAHGEHVDCGLVLESVESTHHVHAAVVVAELHLAQPHRDLDFQQRPGCVLGPLGGVESLDGLQMVAVRIGAAHYLEGLVADVADALFQAEVVPALIQVVLQTALSFCEVETLTLLDGFCAVVATHHNQVISSFVKHSFATLSGDLKVSDFLE